MMLCFEMKAINPSYSFECDPLFDRVFNLDQRNHKNSASHLAYHDTCNREIIRLPLNLFR